MKNYHVFIMYGYYPSAFDDYEGSFESFDEAHNFGMDNRHGRDYFQVIGTQEDGSLEMLAYHRYE